MISSAVSFIVVTSLTPLSLALYLLPCLIGCARRAPDMGAVAVVNILLGWTLIGWVAALAMAFRSAPPGPPPPAAGPDGRSTTSGRLPHGRAHRRRWLSRPGTRPTRRMSVIQTAPPRGSDDLVGLREWFWVVPGQWRTISCGRGGRSLAPRA